MNLGSCEASTDIRQEIYYDDLTVHVASLFGLLP